MTPEIKTIYALIELYPDGYIKVYGEKSLQIEIVNRPYCISEKGELLAEQLVDSILPEGYREIFWPGMVRKTGILRTITPQQIQRVVGQVFRLNVFSRNSSPRYRRSSDVVRELLRG